MERGSLQGAGLALSAWRAADAEPAHFRRNQPMSRWRTGTVLGNPKYWEAGQSPTSERIAAKRRKHSDPKSPTHVSERSDQQPSHLLLPRDGVTQITESCPQSLSGRTRVNADRTFLMEENTLLDSLACSSSNTTHAVRQSAVSLQRAYDDYRTETEDTSTPRILYVGA